MHPHSRQRKWYQKPKSTSMGSLNVITKGIHRTTRSSTRQTCHTWPRRFGAEVCVPTHLLPTMRMCSREMRRQPYHSPPLAGKCWQRQSVRTRRGSVPPRAARGGHLDMPRTLRTCRLCVCVLRRVPLLRKLGCHHDAPSATHALGAGLHTTSVTRAAWSNMAGEPTILTPVLEHSRDIL